MSSIKNKSLFLRNLLFVSCCSLGSCSPEDSDQDYKIEEMEEEIDNPEEEKEEKIEYKSTVELREEAQQEIQNLRDSFFEKKIFYGTPEEESTVGKLINFISLSLGNSLQNRKNINYETIIRHCKRLMMKFDNRATLIFEFASFAKYVEVPKNIIEELKSVFPVESINNELRNLWGLNFDYFTIEFNKGDDCLDLFFKNCFILSLSLDLIGLERKDGKMVKIKELKETEFFKNFNEAFVLGGSEEEELKGLLKKLEESDSQTNINNIRLFFSKLL